MVHTKSDILDLTVHLHRETYSAILVSVDGNEDAAVWLPRSKIKIELTKREDIIEIQVPQWLAEQRGLP